MGKFRRRFGGRKGQETSAASTGAAPRGEYKQCDSCGDLAEVSEQVNAAIFTTDISVFSHDGMAGFCPSCGRFLCSKHLEFQNASGGEMGPWQVGCVECRVPIQAVP